MLSSPAIPASSAMSMSCPSCIPSMPPMSCMVMPALRWSMVISAKAKTSPISEQTNPVSLLYPELFFPVSASVVHIVTAVVFFHVVVASHSGFFRHVHVVSIMHTFHATHVVHGHAGVEVVHGDICEGEDFSAMF